MKLVVRTEAILVRTIKGEDNAAIAAVIHKTLEEFGANHPGTVYYDSTTDALFQCLMEHPRTVYFIAEKDGKVVGGGGIFPLSGLAAATCELVKMYLLPEVRGIGSEKILLRNALPLPKGPATKHVH